MTNTSAMQNAPPCSRMLAFSGGAEKPYRPVFGLLLLDLVEDASKQLNIGDRPPDIGITVCHPTPIFTN